MEEFFRISFSFPTVIWTGLLLLCVLYWLIAVAGMADFDVVDADPDLTGVSGGLTGIMVTLGLNGVPFPVALTAVALSGWSLSYFAELVFSSFDPGGLLSLIAGVVILAGSLILSVRLAALLIRPLRKLFRDSKSCNHDVLGTTGTAVYEISSDRGTLDCLVNGAHLRIEARSNTDIAAGEKAVVIRYHKNQSVYQVVPEADFMTGLTR